MKGLFIKDLCILLRQKTSLLIILALGILMSTNGTNTSLAVGYMVVVSTILVINTIAYDYFENGMVFMFTLPISKKAYVLEKYLLAFFMELLSASVVLLIEFVWSLFRPQADWFGFIAGLITTMLVALLLISYYIPVHLKFGPEKSRIALFVLMGIIVLLGYLISKGSGMEGAIDNLAAALNAMGPAMLAGIGVLVVAAAVAVSALISIRILEKKEF